MKTDTPPPSKVDNGNAYHRPMDDLKKLLEEGLDDWWWITEFDLVNRLRSYVGLDPITKEHQQEMIEYWSNIP